MTITYLCSDDDILCVNQSYWRKNHDPNNWKQSILNFETRDANNKLSFTQIWYTDCDCSIYTFTESDTPENNLIISKKLNEDYCFRFCRNPNWYIIDEYNNYDEVSYSHGFFFDQDCAIVRNIGCSTDCQGDVFDVACLEINPVICDGMKYLFF